MRLIPYGPQEGFHAEDDRPAGRQTGAAIVSDVVDQSLVTLGRLSAGSVAGDCGSTAVVSLSYARTAVTPGDVARIPLSLTNVNSQTYDCALCVTDLIGVARQRIPASHVRIWPNPVRIAAAGSTEVQIEIRVPSDTPTGRYTGLLQDDRESLRTLVQLTVGPDRASSVSVLPGTPPHGDALAMAPPPQRPHVVSKALQAELRKPFEYTLVHLAQVKASLAKREVIGPTPNGLRINFLITGGRIEGERFNATFDGGGADALRVREDGIAIAAIRTTLTTDDGARVFTEYSGVLDLGADGYENALRGTLPPRPPVYLVPRFLCGSPAYAWLNRLQCVGIGYVTMADLEINFDLYAMRLSDAATPR
jgi:hypothetical protein